MTFKKELNLLDIYSLTTGMISSGIFLLPGLAFALTGSSAILAYICAGLLAMTGMFSIAELSSAMPKSGGDYFYINRCLGPAVGCIAGIISWLALVFKGSFAIVGVGEFIKLLMHTYSNLTLILISVFFILINILSVKKSSGIQNIFIFILISILIFFILKGLPKIDVKHYKFFMPFGFKNFLFTTGFIFISYGGLLKVASISEEVKKPEKIIPLGLILSLGSCVIMYSALVFITIGVLNADTLSKTLTPLSDAALIFMGKSGYIILSLAGIFAFLSTANFALISASRYLVALSQDNLIPPIYLKFHQQFKTPYFSILFSGFFIIFFLFVKLEILIEAASIGIILIQILTNLSVIIMRESHIQNYLPKFKSPLYPFLQIFGIICFIFLIFQMGLTATLITFIFILFSFFVYWFYGRKRVEQEFALLHLIERITAKELVTGTLENELKEIILYRDEIVPDQFDKLIATSNVIDLEKRMKLNELLELIAERLENELKEIILYRDEIVPDQFDKLIATSNVIDLEKGMKLNELLELIAERLEKIIGKNKEKLYELLLERENVSSTALTDYLAIPHIVFNEPQQFTLLIVRNKEGIYFDEAHQNIKAVFVIVSSINDRNLHLKILAAIAQISMDEKFLEKWLKAKNEQSIKDVLLLARRVRNIAL